MLQTHSPFGVAYYSSLCGQPSVAPLTAVHKAVRVQVCVTTVVSFPLDTRSGPPRSHTHATVACCLPHGPHCFTSWAQMTSVPLLHVLGTWSTSLFGDSHVYSCKAVLAVALISVFLTLTVAEHGCGYPSAICVCSHKKRFLRASLFKESFLLKAQYSPTAQ